MPFHYVIDKERRLVISTAWDRLTFAEIKTHQDKLTSDPDFNPEFNQLLDGTAVTVLDISIDEVKTLASRRVFSPESRSAFVATRPAHFGMGRLWGIYHEMSRAPSEVWVFADLPSALKWLGLAALPDPIKTLQAKKAGVARAAKNDKIA